MTITSGEGQVSVVGTVIGNRNRPHLLEAWGQRFQVQLEDHITLFRYRDLPGMLGTVGTCFGRHGVNIVSSIVGRQPDGHDGDALAAMVITTDVPVPRRSSRRSSRATGSWPGAPSRFRARLFARDV